MNNSKSIPYWDGNELVIFDASLNRDTRWLRYGNYRKYLGITLICLSLISFLAFVSPVLATELSYRWNMLNRPALPAVAAQVHPEAGNAIESGFGKYLWLESAGLKSPKSWDYSLVIPKVDINTLIIPSVDPNDQTDYEAALKSGVAQAKGSGNPGEGKSVYIFGHSSDYLWNNNNFAAVLYPLRYLKTGDPVYVVYKQKIYIYKVVEKKVVDSGDVQYLNNPQHGEQLILQTCWPPQTDWQRLLIIAKPVSK